MKEAGVRAFAYIIYRLAEPIAVGEDSSEAKVPRDFKLLMSKVEQPLVVLSEGPSGAEDEEMTEKLAVEGRVVQRADCRPLNPSNDYFLHKRKSIQVASKPARQAQQLKKIVTNAYKPVSDHKMNIEYKKKKKDEGKRARATEEDVKASLFSAFEQHQYYNLKDLVHKTQQPIVYLKSILKEIAQYNTKNPHKNMWELKPEYRHYGKNTEDKDSS
ncbi:general transcription factor IIF subunit 2 isoform X2 [Nematostella vectensis]|uniref:general transcription factor IIF subunit 2 isoform X2 n=1 Tax=Nematostella vectensis TaxID=45351 RepID=UPI0013905FE3|nr:general transcription factor IIF subunit 2 isoform X2 [Nematostella vectensis]